MAGHTLQLRVPTAGGPRLEPHRRETCFSRRACKARTASGHSTLHILYSWLLTSHLLYSLSSKRGAAGLQQQPCHALRTAYAHMATGMAA